MSDKLPAIVRPFEGCRLVAYRCPAGVWTVGWGHTSAAGAPFVTEGLKITQAQADAILARDLEAVRVQVAKLCAGAKGGCADDELDAFASLAFNIGVPSFAKSTALRKYRRGDKRGAADAVLAWNKARVNGQLVVVAGLVRRRKAERALFLEGHAAAAAQVDGQDFGAMPQAVARPVLRKPITRSVTANASAGTLFGGALFTWEGGKQAVAFMSDAKEQASAAATLFGIPEGSAVLLGGGIVIIAGAGVVLWRRYRRSIEDLVIDAADGLHLPFIGDLLGREEAEVEVEATHVEATVETDEGVVHASTTHIQALVTATADEAVQAVEDAVDPAPAPVPVEAPRTSFVENAAQISPIVAPAPVSSPAAPPAQPVAAVVAWPGAGAN